MARRSSVSSVNPEKNYGKPFEYDSNFKGPRDRRGCTDVLFLILFIAFLACWAVVGIIAFVQGDPQRILNPTDYSGRQCGVHADVLRKPYLLFFDPSLCARANPLISGCSSPSVCVSACPETEFNAERHYRASSLNGINTICLPGVYPRTGPELRQAVEQNKCAKWYMRSMPGPGGRLCLPQLVDLEPMKPLLVEGQQVVGTAVEEVLKGNNMIRNAKETGDQIVSDLLVSYPFIVVGLVGAMVVCFVYILLLRWFTAPVVWVSILAVLTLIGTGVYASYKFWDQLKNDKASQLPWEELPPGLASFLNDPSVWLGVLIVLSIILVVLLLVVLFLRNRIRLATALIEQGGRAVSKITSTLLFPLVPWALQVTVLVYTAVVILYLATNGEAIFKVAGLQGSGCVCEDAAAYQDGDVCTVSMFNAECGNCVSKGASCQFFRYRPTEYILWLQLFNIFGAIWSLFFISGMAHMILAATFASWYWTFHKSDVPFFVLTRSFFMCITYHSGTVAFGSLIIAIVRFIRMILAYIEKKTKKYADNGFTRVVMCFCQCCFACLERFLKFISYNAYIMCAIHGKNLCSSAKDAFNLLMRNVIRVVVIDKIMDFTFFMGKVLITAVVCTAMYFSLQQWPQKLNFNAVPITVSGIGAFLIASVFFGVYSVAVETLFLCFLEDCERNDGTEMKPYFMSPSLMRIFGKKNRTKRD